jgi:alcohol dehydrogenase class IV
MKLMVVSPSTKKYAKDFNYDEMKIIKHPPTKEILKEEDKYHNVIAIGGGSVLDSAKILSQNSIIAVPTTYSGASGTEHAVYWEKGKKHNRKCKMPITIYKDKYLKKLPKEIEAASKIDCMCHLIESILSPNACDKSDYLVQKSIIFIRNGDWLKGSVYAGNAINITGTNLIHGLSYGITGKYNLPHGIALAEILNLSKRYKKVEELL